MSHEREYHNQYRSTGGCIHRMHQDTLFYGMVYHTRFLPHLTPIKASSMLTTLYHQIPGILRNNSISESGAETTVTP